MVQVSKELRENGKLSHETAEAIVIAIGKMIDDKAASRSDLAEAVNKIERAILAAQTATQEKIHAAQQATAKDAAANRMTVLYFVVGAMLLNGPLMTLLKKLLPGIF